MSPELVLLVGAFLVIAAVYASVGFGGGSSYTSLLVLAALPVGVVPILSLSCNLIVTAGGALLFWRRRHVDADLVWPFLVSSIPMAYLGGRLQIEPFYFLVTLGVALVLAGAALLATPLFEVRKTRRPRSLPLMVLVGGALGFLSGIVGIGGGIFLAPTLLLLGWGEPKQVAATASIFIFVNSVAGLLGQLTKHDDVESLALYLPLAVAVLVGGQIGSRLASGPLSPRVVRGLTGVLVLLVGGRILLQSISS